MTAGPLEELTPEVEARVRRWIAGQHLRCACQVCAEARALLGEVDRLRAEAGGLREHLAQIAAVVDAGDGEPDGLEPGDWEVGDLMRAVGNVRRRCRAHMREEEGRPA